MPVIYLHKWVEGRERCAFQGTDASDPFHIDINKRHDDQYAYRMRKTFQFRLYPTMAQEAKLNKTLSTCRHLYNDALEVRRKQAELNRLKRSFDIFPWGKPEWINKYEQMHDLATLKTSYQKEVFSQVLQDVIKRVDRSFKNFFNGFGYPRFSGMNRYNSFTYPQLGFKIQDGKLDLSKIGNVRIIMHRELEGKIKTCTIRKDIYHWYVSFSCELEEPAEVEIKTRIGIDRLKVIDHAEYWRTDRTAKIATEIRGQINTRTEKVIKEKERVNEAK